jgi:hypothetical protein
LGLVAGAAVSAWSLAACSSSATSSSSTTPAQTSSLKSAHLCETVGASVIATILNTNMNPTPKTLVRGSSAQCYYQTRKSSSTAVLIRFDTNSNATMFAKDRALFEEHGQKLAPISHLGDEAYYFADTVEGSPLTTVVARQGSLQVLVTGTGTWLQLGNIGHYALAQSAPSDSTTTSTSG